VTGRATGSVWLRRSALYLALAIVAAYAFVGLVLVDYDSLFSVDAAVKILQAQSLRDSGFTSVALPYPAQDLDPEYRFVPFRPPFVFRYHGAIQGVYPIAVALLNALALSVGLPGLVLLSVGSALIVLLATGHSARAHAVPVILLLGVGTPFWAYGVLPWEHMPALACSALAGTLLEGRSASRGLAAGILLGAAIALRGEFALLIPGLALLHLRSAEWRRIVGAALGVSLPLLLVAALDAWVYERPPFSHVAHAVDLMWTWFGAGSSVERPEVVPLLQRVDVIVGYWIFGLPNGAMMGLAAAAAFIAGRFLSRQMRGHLVVAVLVLATVLLIRDLVVFVVTPDFVAGLLRVSPVLLFAVLPVGGNSPSTRRRRAEQALLLVFAVGLLTSSRHAGAQIGPRFMLPIFPLVVTLAWEGLQSYREGAKKDANDRMVWLLGLALIAGSVTMQVFVAVPAYIRLNADERPIVRALRTSLPPVVVLSDMYLINHVASVYRTSKVLLATGPSQTDELGRRLTDHNVEGVALVARPNQRFALPPFVGHSEVTTPRTSLSYVVRPTQ